MGKVIEKPLTPSALADRMLIIGSRQLELEGLEGEMNAELDAVKARYTARVSGLAASIERLETALGEDVTAARKELLGDGKSTATLFGRCGFRLGKPHVGLQRGTKEEDAVRAIQRACLEQFLRQRFELNRARILEAVSDGVIPAENLKVRFGLVVRGAGESFYLTIDRASVRDALTKGGR